MSGRVSFDLGDRHRRLTRLAGAAGVAPDEYARAIVAMWVDRHEPQREHRRSSLATRIVHYFSKLDRGDGFTLADVMEACPGYAAATVSSQMRVLRHAGEIEYRRRGHAAYERL